MATAQADVANIQATVESVKATATVISRRAGLNSIDQGSAEITINIDAQGLLDGDEEAEDAAIAEIRDALEPYEECRVGIVLTFGWDPDVRTGSQISERVNALLREARPEMFEDAVTENFANIGPQGLADLQVFFFRGCLALDED